jgi:hypothetical protein
MPKPPRWSVNTRTSDGKRLARIRAIPGYKATRHDAHVRAWKARPKPRSGKPATALHDAHLRAWHKTKPAESWRHRYRCDPEFNLRERVRARSRKITIDAYAYKYTSSLVKRGSESQKFCALVGYGIRELRLHLERQFHGRMNWSAFMRGDIHIDHIVPRSRFDMTDPDEVRACWALSNLRPVWSSVNIKKSAKRTHLI